MQKKSPNNTTFILIVLLCFSLIIMGIFIAERVSNSNESASEQQVNNNDKVPTPGATIITDLLEEDYMLTCKEVTDIVILDNEPLTMYPGEAKEITGQIPGGWCFEAQCNVDIVDVSGPNSIYVDDWMTDELVNFSGKLMLPPNTMPGEYSLVIWAGNPSGLPANCRKTTYPLTVGSRS